MRSKSILLSLLVVLVYALSSCAPDAVYSKDPQYHGTNLYFTDADPKLLTGDTQNNTSIIRRINTCKAGSKVTVFLPIYVPGEYIYKTTYKWSYALKSDPDKKKLGGAEIVDDKDPCSRSVPPMWTFDAPTEPGEYVMYFRAVYSYSAQSPDGSGSTKGEFPSRSGSHGYEDKSSVYGIFTVK